MTCRVRIAGFCALGALSLLAGALLPHVRVHRAGADDGEPSRVSSVILPAQSDPLLKFDHTLEPHRSQKCARCHEQATQSGSSRQRLMPSERHCNPCHAETTREGAGGAVKLGDAEQASDPCATCHTGEPRAFTARAPNIKFSHRTHARAGVRCFDCHTEINRVDPPGRRHMPKMESCLSCHGGTSAQSSDACTTCHLAMGPEGHERKMRTTFGSKRLKPPNWLWGMGHDSDFLVRHRWVAADQGAACASCHSESECVDCHDGRVRSTRVHPHGFLGAHATAALRNNPNCTSCHAVQRFCTECHARLGLSSISAPRSRISAGRFHPPTEVWTEGPALHGVEAQRSLQSCVSCHREEDCIDCHGSSQTGRRGVSPHSASFFSRCDAMLRANPRGCLSCHAQARCR